MAAREPTRQPHTTARAEAERLARQAREAAALRENLRKRKAQARSRIPPAPETASPSRPDDAPDS